MVAGLPGQHSVLFEAGTATHLRMSLADVHIQMKMVADIQMVVQQKERNLVVAAAHIQLRVVGTVAAVTRMLVEVAEFHKSLVLKAAAAVAEFHKLWVGVAAAVDTSGLLVKKEAKLGLKKPFQTDPLAVLLAVLMVEPPVYLLVEHQKLLVVHSLQVVLV
mmetsp:Transcript_9138/g.18120  ORF Transcript_9138/g.18120 Transcript_9138/m.18120 type:complete len:161 (-) Transcript_9138:49-531(-)